MANNINPPSARLYGDALTNPETGGITTSWIQWLQAFYNAACTMLGVYNSGVTATLTLAKLTGGGANGSLTFQNGILVSKVDPT